MREDLSRRPVLHPCSACSSRRFSCCDSYDLKVGEGTASAFAINSGRMAVEHILKSAK
ncbi:hypothetical protein [uncultured Sutterella sp.]|uniref:hypothetical protein n=1 Tax=uncultured Sutterella sp. TaxID=286133 RepID=UPI0025FE7DF8|nr:hypothetical protein [uncultured Sutterella sp.]